MGTHSQARVRCSTSPSLSVHACNMGMITHLIGRWEDLIQQPTERRGYNIVGSQQLLAAPISMPAFRSSCIISSVKVRFGGGALFQFLIYTH